MSAYDSAKIGGYTDSESKFYADLAAIQNIGEVKIGIASEEKLGIIRVGENLKIDENGVLSVDTATAVEQDNTRPVTSAAVQTTVGNIEVLLKTI